MNIDILYEFFIRKNEEFRKNDLEVKQRIKTLEDKIDVLVKVLSEKRAI